MTRRDGARATGTHLWGALLAAGLAFATLLAPTTLAAQQTDGRWLAWTGCWEPVADRAVDGAPGLDETRRMARPADAGEARAGEATATGPTLVCFQPMTGDVGIERIAVEDGRVVSRETLRADGRRLETSAEGCAGWETAEFASRPGRVYVRSEQTCEGGVSRTSSGILSMVSTGAWVDIQVVSAEGESGTWVTRYELASPPDAEAAGFGALGAEQVMAIRTARVAATARPTVDDLIEASGAVEGEAVQAWLVERDAALDLDADALVRLADAGVSEDVIDMAIAVTHPEQFAVEAEEPARYGRYGYDYGRPWGYWDPFYGSMFWSPFGFYRPYGYYGRYYGYGYGYGYPYGRGYGGIRVVPVRGGGDSGGRVISGQGYRGGNGATTGGRGATPRGGAVRAPTGRSAKPRSGGTSGGRVSGARSSGSSSGRTAKPRGGGGGGGSGSGGGSGDPGLL